jgi:hypothetical protein
MKMKPIIHDESDPDALDENGILKDGHGLRISMMARDADSLTPLQRSVRENARATGADKILRDAMKEDSHVMTDEELAQLPWHEQLKHPRVAARVAGVLDRQPGFVVGDEESRRKRQQAYIDSIKAQADEWRVKDALPNSGVGSHQPRGPKEGDHCMTDDRRPGRIDARGKCVATDKAADGVVDMARYHDAREAAYNQMVAELCGAWKHPA